MESRFTGLQNLEPTTCWVDRTVVIGFNLLVKWKGDIHNPQNSSGDILKWSLQSASPASKPPWKFGSANDLYFKAIACMTEHRHSMMLWCPGAALHSPLSFTTCIFRSNLGLGILQYYMKNKLAHEPKMRHSLLEGSAHNSDFLSKMGRRGL